MDTGLDGPLFWEFDTLVTPGGCLLSTTVPAPIFKGSCKKWKGKWDFKTICSAYNVFFFFFFLFKQALGVTMANVCNCMYALLDIGLIKWKSGLVEFFKDIYKREIINEKSLFFIKFGYKYAFLGKV